jgi:hypothetical protein
MASRVRVWDHRYLEFCPFGIDTLIRPTFFGGRTVVNVLVLMFSRQM